MCINVLKIIPCKWSNCDAFFLYFRGILSPTLQCDRLVSMDSAKMRQVLCDLNLSGNFAVSTLLALASSSSICHIFCATLCAKTAVILILLAPNTGFWSHCWVDTQKWTANNNCSKITVIRSGFTTRYKKLYTLVMSSGVKRPNMTMLAHPVKLTNPFWMLGASPINPRECSG